MTAGENQAGGGAGGSVRGFGWGQGMEGGRRGSSGGGEDGVEGLKGSHEEVEVGLGEVAEAAVKDDGEGDVVEGGVVGGGMAGADAAFVLAEAGIAAVMVAVLDGLVATVPGEQLFGVSAVFGDGGDAIGDLLTGFAGL